MIQIFLKTIATCTSFLLHLLLVDGIIMLPLMIHCHEMTSSMLSRVITSSGDMPPLYASKTNQITSFEMTFLLEWFPTFRARPYRSRLLSTLAGLAKLPVDGRPPGEV